MKRAIAVITAVVMKKIMKGSGKVSWKRIRLEIREISDEQRGRVKNQMESCLNFMDRAEEREGVEEEGFAEIEDEGN